MNTNNIYNTLIARFSTWKGVALCAVFGILCLLTSCHTQKATTGVRHRVTAEQQLAQQTIAAQPLFRTAEASKVRIRLNVSEQKFNVSGRLSIITDSIIVLSVQPLLGIEIYRAEITPEQVLVVDKMNRRYVQMDYAEVGRQTGLPLRYEDVQAVFLNRMFVIGKEQSEIERMPFTSAIVENEHRLQLHDNQLHYTFSITPQTYALTRTQASLGQSTAQVEYLNHQLQDNVFFPTTLLFHVDDGNNRITECELTLLNVHFNQAVNIRKADLKRYTQTTINKLFSK